MVPARLSAEDAVVVGALVELECDGTRALYFLGPHAGGFRFSYGDRPVVVVTPRSPIGKKLLGAHEGDGFVVGAGQGQREYDIVLVR